MIELLVRLAISMAVVMAVMGLAARFVRRRQEGGLGGGGLSGRRTGRGGPVVTGRAGSGGPSTLATKLQSVLGAPKPRRARPVPPFEVVYRRALSKGAAVAVIEATGKQFLLGITEQSITLLTELPGATGPTPLDAEPTTSMSTATSPAAATSPGAGAPAPGPGSGPAPRSGTRSGTGGGASQVRDLEIWDEFDDWQQADRMPASPPDAATLERQNAWKLTLDSLRERTIRR
jgi:hypothetical protein